MATGQSFRCSSCGSPARHARPQSPQPHAKAWRSGPRCLSTPVLPIHVGRALALVQPRRQQQQMEAVGLHRHADRARGQPARALTRPTGRSWQALQNLRVAGQAARITCTAHRTRQRRGHITSPPALMKSAISVATNSTLHQFWEINGCEWPRRVPIGTGVSGEIATGEADWAARAMGMISDASGRQTPARRTARAEGSRRRTWGRQRAQDDNSPPCDQSTVKPWRFLCDKAS